MKRTAKRFTALALSLLLLLGVLPAPVWAEEAAEAEAMRAGVFQRYEDYYYGVNNDLLLRNTANYAYCAWADDIESRSGAEKAILWATHKLLGKSLDTDAYIEYLTKILAMQERGFTETLSAQAEYTAQANAVQQAVQLGSVSFSAVLDMGLLEKAAKTLKSLGAGVDLIQSAAATVSNVSEALVLLHFGESYEQKLSLLEAIRDNTDDKHLKEAAEALIGTATLEFSYYVEQLGKKAFGDYADFTLNLNGAYDFSELLETAATELADNFEPWAKFALTGGGDMAAARLAALPKAALYGVGKFVSAASYLKAGFSIGGAVMALFFADDVELFREMKAMDVTGDALSAALVGLSESIDNSEGEEKYAAIRDFVAAGQGLCYVRLRGEYCAVESIRGKDSAPDNLDEIFGRTTDLLSRAHNALARIFPDTERQVIVTVSEENTAEAAAQTSIARIQVHVSDKPEVGEAIVSGEALTALYTSAAEERDDVIEQGRRYAAGYPYDYTLKLFDAYATSGALSLQFMAAAYLGGAHPMSSRFTYTFDLETGALLTLEDLIDDENAQARDSLIDAFTQALRSAKPDLPDPAGNIRSVFDGTQTQNYWYFTRDGLAITFPPYAIAAYGAGYITALVPYDALNGLIDSTWLPSDRSSQRFTAACSFYPREEALGGDYTNFYGAESTFGVSADGDALDVIAGEGYSSATSTYRDNVLFYANFLTAADLVWLPETGTQTYIVESIVKNDFKSEGTPHASLFTAESGGFREEDVVLTQ